MINIKNAKYFAIILLLTGNQVAFSVTQKQKTPVIAKGVKIIDPSLTQEENKVINILEELVSDKNTGKTLQQYITEIVNTIRSNTNLINNKPEYKLACDVLTEINNTVLAGVKVIRSNEISNYKTRITTILNKYNLKSLDCTLPENIIKYCKNNLIQRGFLRPSRNSSSKSINKSKNRNSKEKNITKTQSNSNHLELNEFKAFTLLKKRLRGS